MARRWRVVVAVLCLSKFCFAVGSEFNRLPAVVFEALVAPAQRARQALALPHCPTGFDPEKYLQKKKELEQLRATQSNFDSRDIFRDLDKMLSRQTTLAGHTDTWLPPADSDLAEALIECMKGTEEGPPPARIPPGCWPEIQTALEADSSIATHFLRSLDEPSYTSRLLEWAHIQKSLRSWLKKYGFDNIQAAEAFRQQVEKMSDELEEIERPAGGSADRIAQEWTTFFNRVKQIDTYLWQYPGILLGRLNSETPWRTKDQAIQHIAHIIKRLAFTKPPDRTLTAASIYEEIVLTFAKTYESQELAGNLGIRIRRVAIVALLALGYPLAKVIAESFGPTFLYTLKNLNVTELVSMAAPVAVTGLFGTRNARLRRLAAQREEEAYDESQDDLIGKAVGSLNTGDLIEVLQTEFSALSGMDIQENLYTISIRAILADAYQTHCAQSLLKMAKAESQIP